MTPLNTRGFFIGRDMQQAQQQIHQILTLNQGNRLTPELINGLTARIQMVVAEYGQREATRVREELQAEKERSNG